MFKRILKLLAALYSRKSREFYDQREMIKFDQQRPRDALELAAIHGMMR